MSNITTKEKLFTSSYICAWMANFLLFFSFYLIMPLLALYLIQKFSVEESVVGAVLSCYTLACLFIRPFSGYLVDAFPRKKLYLLALFFFVSLFLGYPVVSTVFLFAVLRILHGFAFGMVSISSNTIVIDIMPASRRGEGLGYYGLSNNFAMATGPMVGLWLLNHYSFETIFYVSFFVCSFSFLFGSFVKTKQRDIVKNQEKISLDRFVLKKGLPAGFNLMLLAFPYGIMTSFIALYAKELNLQGDSSFFYMALAFGIASSRLFSGKQVDKGYLLRVIKVGMAIAIMAFFLLSMLRYSYMRDSLLLKAFYFSAFLIGVGYGTLFPAMNSLFVALASANKRGTATSTYLTSWDIGIGIGLFLGGMLSQYTSFSTTFLFGAILGLLSLIIFITFTSHHFIKNRLNEV